MLSPPLTSLASTSPPKEATALASSPSTNHIATGYADGVVRVWNIDTWECESTFSGHKGAVTALRFSSTGALLASGSQDCSIVVWDVSGEAGLYRLIGHRGQVTDLVFLSPSSDKLSDDHTIGPSPGLLASSSKDECVRVWELESQHCCQSITGIGGEVWSLDTDPTGRRLAIGSSDVELRIFAINTHQTQDQMDVLTAMGSIRRSAPERVATVRYYETRHGNLLVCQGAGKVTDLWRVRSDTEARKRMKRRQRRRREKGRGATTGEEGQDGALGSKGNQGDEGEGSVLFQVEAVDELQPNGSVRSKHKATSCALLPMLSTSGGKGMSRRLTHGGSSQPIRLALALSNNSIEIWEVKQESMSVSKEAGDSTQKLEGEGKEELQQEVFQADKVSTIDGPGHRSDVRALALSTDDSLCLSTSNSGVKVWNPRTGACLRTISEVGYGLSAVFAPGNKHAVIATKEGGLEVVDIAGAERVGLPVEAHEGPAWSVVTLPDGSGLVSGGADNNVIFWEWDLLHTGNGNTGAAKEGNGADVQLGLTQTRTMTMTDDVLCVRVSPDGRLLAVALLDSTVRVFFVDTLKFFLSMYGHKLPVLSMDISSDGTLLATGSADKNLKIWGLDFGDCHRSLFAHSDSVTAVAFVPKTHYIFTTGKDGLVKYWDADKFELLLELNGHHGQVWALAVSSLGDFLLTGSHDRSIRRWERTDEPFFVEEEKEKRLESLFEEDLVRDDSRPADLLTVPQNGDAEAGFVAGKKTVESVSAADAIIDALDLASAEEERLEEFEKAGGGGGSEGKSGLPPNPLLLGLSPSQYVLKALMQVRSTELEQALLLVPFTDALRLLGYLSVWLEEGSGGTKVESLTRATALLLRVHLHQLSSTPSAKEILLKLQSMLKERVQNLKDTMGINLAAVGHLGRLLAERKRTPALEDAAAVVKRQKMKNLE